MCGAFAHPVTPHRRAVQLPLIAEGRVQALPSDAHRIHEHLSRTALEPVFAKDADRGVECSVRVELSGSGHAPVIPKWERSFNNDVAGHVPSSSSSSNDDMTVRRRSDILVPTTWC